MDKKVCTKCNIAKNLDEFSNDSKKKDGKYSSCKLCKSNAYKIYKLNNKKTIAEAQKNYYIQNLDKIKEYHKDYYINNKNTILEKNKTYYNNNYDKIKKTQFIWDENNKDKITQYMKEYSKKRCKNDINFHIKINLRSRFKQAVKNSYYFNYLGCDISFFKSWIEYQFNTDKNLSWNNYGKYWHFDHIMPCASFNFENEDDIKNCFNWKNIRPLNKNENLRKKDKIDYNLIEHHNKLIQNFLEKYDVPSV